MAPVDKFIPSNCPQALRLPYRQSDFTSATQRKVVFPRDDTRCTHCSRPFSKWQQQAALQWVAINYLEAIKFS